MGGGVYSVSARRLRATTMGYDTKPREEIFMQRSVNNAMNPHGVVLREARDSEEHPNSLAIILALDVTGSMGSIPHYLVKNGLPSVMEGLFKANIKDPQVLFMGIGDHECDHAPLQIGQFESSDELLDKWLTDIFLEGGGGGNDGESYLLAWYFAAKRTALDCFEKRNQKGFLFTIGDEPCLRSIPSNKLKGIMGDGQFETYDAAALLGMAREHYNVYHIHVREGSNGRRPEVVNGWKELVGDNLIILENYRQDLAKIIAEKVNAGLIADPSPMAAPSSPTTTGEGEMML